MKHGRILILLTPIVIFFLFELYFFYQKTFYYSIFLAIILILFTVRQISRKSEIDKNWWNFLILPACFLVSVSIYSSLLTNNFYIQLLFFVNMVFLYFYLRNIYYYLIRPEFYKAQTLENLSSYGNFLVIFFFSSAMYGLQSFLNITISLLIFFILLLFALVIYQVIWANRIDMNLGFIFILVLCLILVEIAWSASFLPLNYNVLGMVLAICYYILIGLTRFYLKDKLNTKIIKLYLFSGFISIFILLLTSSWI